MNETTTQQIPPQEPRRLVRVKEGRVIGGVSGGLGGYFGIDPIIVRIAAVVLLLFGGARRSPTSPSSCSCRRSRGPASPRRQRTAASLASIIAVVVLVLVGWPLLLVGGLTVAGIAFPLAVLVLAGLLVWWLVSGEGPGGSAGEIAKRAALGIGVLLLCFAIFVGGFWAAGLGGGTAARRSSSSAPAWRSSWAPSSGGFGC